MVEKKVPVFPLQMSPGKAGSLKPGDSQALIWEQPLPWGACPGGIRRTNATDSVPGSLTVTSLQIRSKRSSGGRLTAQRYPQAFLASVKKQKQKLFPIRRF